MITVGMLVAFIVGGLAGALLMLFSVRDLLRQEQQLRLASTTADFQPMDAHDDPNLVYQRGLAPLREAWEAEHSDETFEKGGNW